MTINDKKVSNVRMLAAALASVIGVLFYNVMPIYLGALQDSSGLGIDQIGFVASAFFLGFIVASASAYFWVRRLRVASTAILLTIGLGIAFYLGTKTNTAAPTYLLSVVIGAASGAMTALAATLIGDNPNAKVWYGVKVALESFAGVSLLFILPMTLIPKFGFLGVVIGMVAVMTLILPALFFLQSDKLGDTIEHQNSVPTSAVNTEVLDNKFVISMGILAMFLFFVGGAAVWAFAERVATAYGFDGEKVGMILSVALFFAVIGPLLSGPISGRIGIKLPFLISAIGMAIGVFLMSGSEGALNLYASGACLFMLGWGGGNPLIFSKIAANDAGGKFVTLSISALGLGSMVGPAVAGKLLLSEAVDLLQWFVVAAIALSALCIWISGGAD